MARIILNRASEAKATSPQFMRGVVLTCQKSPGYDPKPFDLSLGRVKWR